MTISLKPLDREDKNGWLELWQGFLENYGENASAHLTFSTFDKLVTKEHPLRARIALDEKAVGIVPITDLEIESAPKLVGAVIIAQSQLRRAMFKNFQSGVWIDRSDSHITGVALDKKAINLTPVADAEIESAPELIKAMLVT